MTCFIDLMFVFQWSTVQSVGEGRQNVSNNIVADQGDDGERTAYD